jgi:hypothetical protein
MTDKTDSDRHRKEGGQQQGQQRRGQRAQDDRRHESGKAGGEPAQQDVHPDKRSHSMEREKADKGQGGPV